MAQRPKKMKLGKKEIVSVNIPLVQNSKKNSNFNLFKQTWKPMVNVTETIIINLAPFRLGFDQKNKREIFSFQSLRATWPSFDSANEPKKPTIINWPHLLNMVKYKLHCRSRVFESENKNFPRNESKHPLRYIFIDQWPYLA